MAAAPFPLGPGAPGPPPVRLGIGSAVAMGVCAACCCALATAWSACSLVKLLVAPHIVHTERYLVPTGMKGMKNSEKNGLDPDDPLRGR